MHLRPDSRPPERGGTRGAALLALRVVAAATLAAAPASAQISNGGFESGDLGGWVVEGTGRVEVLEGLNFSPTIPQPQGTYYVLLSSGPGDVADGGDWPPQDLDGNGINEFDIAVLRQTFTTPADDDVLSLRWGFLSREADQPATYDDVFIVRIDGVTVLARSTNKPGGVSPFPDSPPYDGLQYDVTSSGPTDGSFFWDTSSDGFTGFVTFSIVIPSAGDHTLEILIADQGDGLFDSGLLVDDVILNSGGDLFQITDTSGAELESKGGGLVWTPAESRTVAVSDDGLTLAFTSTGDYGTANPNVQTQVFVASGAGFERLTTMTDGSASRPSVSPDGRWIAYSATDNPFSGGSPNNDDLNEEIFVRDRTLGTTWQVTETTTLGCASRAPSIAGAIGSVVAFQTSCPELTGGAASTTVVVWDGASFRTPPGFSGCTSRSPELSADGSRIAFVSECDPSGANGDGNQEVFLWELATDTTAQLTSSAGASGEANDAVDVSADGSIVVFVSNADLDAGTDNSDANFEVFLWDSGGITQITDTAFDAGALQGDVHLTSRVSDSGRFVTYERLNAFTNLTSIGVIDRQTGSEALLVSGRVALPDIGVDITSDPIEPRTVVAFESDLDLVPGDNSDGNLEVFTSRLVVPPNVERVCSAPGTTIPSQGTITDTIILTSGTAISDLDVELRFLHARISDLIVTLTSPVGTAIELFNRIRTDGGGLCNRDDMDAVLDDEGARDVQTECANQTPTVLSPPPFTPNGPLSLFDGLSTSGLWTITINDVRNAGNGDDANLIEWCLVVR